MTKKILSTFLPLALVFFLFSCSKGNSGEIDDNNSSTPTAVELNLPGAYFTEPAKVAAGESSPLIMQKIIQTLQAITAGDSVHLCIYLMDYAALETEIIRAHERGVVVKMLIDRSREESIQMNSFLIPRLALRLRAPSEVVATVSDVSATAINHNKFLLASSVVTTQGKKSNITFQTSHNWNQSETIKMQDALTLSHEGLYQAFRNYWWEMRNRAASGMRLFPYTEYNDPNLQLTAFFFPKRRNGSSFGDDTVIEMLDKITDPSKATIRVGMSDWVQSRVNVAEKLVTLREQGAQVEVVVKSSIDAAVQEVLRTLQSKGGYVKMYNMTQAGRRVNIHAKFMLIEGSWEGKTGNEARVLITGSHNFTTNALRNNNEVMIQWVNPPVYNQYIDFYNQLKAVPGINF